MGVSGRVEEGAWSFVAATFYSLMGVSMKRLLSSWSWSSQRLSTPLWEFLTELINAYAYGVLDDNFLLPYGSFIIKLLNALLKLAKLLSTPLWEFPHFSENLFPYQKGLELSTPLWEFRGWLSAPIDRPNPWPPLSTPLWEFLLLSSTRKML